jgi:hypothetical protein
MNKMNTFLLPSRLTQLQNSVTKSKRYAGLLCLLLLLFCATAKAQVEVGDTEFWFVAPDLDGRNMCGMGPDPGDSPMMILITNGSAQTAHVNLRLYKGNLPMDIPQTVLTGESWRYVIPDKGWIENPTASAGNVTGYGVHITSDVKVTAYYQTQASCNQELFALKGKPALGTFFYVPMIHDSYYYTGALGYYPNARDQIDIVATEDGTEVSVIPAADIRVSNGLWTKGTELVRTLNKGQTLKIMEYDALRTEGSASLAATRISATHPVAVTTTEDLIGRSGLSGYDVIGDQIVPVSSLGKRYVVIKGYNNGSERVYMIATEDGAVISVHNGTMVTSSGTLNAGDCWVFDMENNLTGPAVITVYADNPFYCYQVTGDVGNELGSALLPDAYAVSQTQVSFYSYDNIYLSLLFRTGSENDFTLSYGNVSDSAITMTSTMPVPGMPEWMAAKYTVPSYTQDNVVTIKNTSSMFGLGCFVNYPIPNSGTSYGYFSSFQTYELPDTTYKCAGTSITLDAGYGTSYEWILPDGSTSDSATITITDTGRYIVTIVQNSSTITDTTLVLNRFEGASAVITNINSSSFTYSVNLAGQTDAGVTYEWTDGSTVLSDSSTLTLPLTSTEEKTITLTITDVNLGCTKTFNMGNKMPDNIVDADCYTDPPATQWDIKHKTVGTQVLNSMITPVVGDLDGDGIPEIIALGSIYDGGNSGRSLYVYYGNDRDNPQKIDLTDGNGTIKNLSIRNMGAIAIVKVDLNSNGTFVPVIIVHNTDGKLRAYDPAKTGNNKFVWESDNMSANFTNPNNYLNAHVSVHVADFNNDGHPEVYTSNRIFDAATGKLLVKGPDTDNRGLWELNYGALGYYFYYYFTHAADVCGDARLELLAGTKVYDVVIADRTGLSASNTMIPIRSISDADATINGTLYKDGATFAVDMNQDGRLDIVYRSISAKTIGIIAWDVETQQVIAQVKFTDSPSTYSTAQASIPFAGDIDGNGDLELLMITTHRLRVFAVDISTKQFVQRPEITITDGSGMTGITLFDFNQDGTAELVYRDEATLKIYNVTSSGLTPVSGSGILCRSATLAEYPLVADVDNDGSAEIVTVGIPTSAGNIMTTHGSLFIIKSQTAGAWAPARKVWNQYAYNAVNINEDLTVPRYQLNPATFFLGEDGTLGDGADIQPYNNFLQQQTALSVKGTPLWLTPDVKFVETPTFLYDALGDSLVISLKLTNIGDALLTAPFYVSAYKDASIVGNKITTDSCMTALNVSDTLVFTVTIRNLSSYQPLDNIIIRINDKGEAVYVQKECDTNNNTLTVPFSSLLLAQNDYCVTTTTDIPVYIDVLANDTIPSGCTRAFSLVAPFAKHGTATPDGEGLLYTPNANFAGLDTLAYQITCNENTSTAYVYITVTHAGTISIENIPLCIGMAGIQLIEQLPSAGVISGYQWQVSTDSSNWIEAPTPNTGTDYTYPAAIDEKTYFRRAVITTCDTLYSYATITPNPVPVITLNIQAICLGTSIILPSPTSGIWRNDSTHITSMDNNNVITGISAGEATFVFTDNETGCSVGISIMVDTFPDADEITGKAVVCINQSIELSNTIPNGVWTSNNNNVTFDNPAANSVTVTGVTEGKTFVSYTVSNGVCQTKRTHLLKVISNTPPTVIIGIER